ncbi:hypothetical protein [Consotaella aegiceratis]|uniref:hypothetical protein n=1 Tax=Consotaella aegiceratis TaxID=3097961 RepID=UPI002F41AC56
MADTPKEQCFKEAMDAYENATGDDLGAKWKQQWYREDGKWYQASKWRSFKHWINSIRKTQRIRKGTEAERGADAINPEQWRIPDLTIGDTVVDLKFTNKAGRIDPTGTKEGIGGFSQQHDYNEINGRKTDSDIVALDKDSCKCAERAKEGKAQPHTVTVPDPMTGLHFVPVIINPIGGLAGLLGGAAEGAAGAAGAAAN